MSESSEAVNGNSGPRTSESPAESRRRDEPSSNNPENGGHRHHSSTNETRIEIPDDEGAGDGNDGSDEFRESSGPAEQEMQEMYRGDEETLCRICYLPTEERVSAWKVEQRPGA